MVWKPKKWELPEQRISSRIVEFLATRKPPKTYDEADSLVEELAVAICAPLEVEVAFRNLKEFNRMQETFFREIKYEDLSQKKRDEIRDLNFELLKRFNIRAEHESVDAKERGFNPLWERG
jgi:hypothetical protein